MALLAKCFVILTFALFATALATPHIARNVHHHRALVHPKGAVEGRIPLPAALRRTRALGRRCSPQPANATSSTPSVSTPASVPVNVAANPADSTPSSSAPQEPAYAPTPTPTPTPTPEYSPAPSTSSPAAAATSPASSSGSGSYPSYMSGTQSGQGRHFHLIA